MYDASWWGHMWLQPYNYLTNKKVKHVQRAYFQEDWREWSIWFTANAP